MFFCRQLANTIQISLEAALFQEMDQIVNEISKQYSCDKNRIKILKKSLDARSKIIKWQITAEIGISNFEKDAIANFKYENVANSPEIHIIGAGPAGLFAALQCIELGFKPVIFERGKAVKERRRDLAEINKRKIINPESNYCFGEGGAGTYSDGKLYTRSDKKGPVQKVLAELVNCGAVENILYEAHPHIGTNKLPQIIESLRNKIIDCGGEVHFEKKLTDFIINFNSITELIVNNNETIKINKLILATGHSARDIFELLNTKKVAIESKPFALGVRIEHPQQIVDQIQYKCTSRPEYLPPSSYSLVQQVKGRGVFSFCMCPGGIIAPAATNSGEVVVNGWSPSKRNGKFANSGFVVSVDDQDFSSYRDKDALAGLYYQQKWEQAAFAQTESLSAPAQRLEDFIQGKFSNTLPECSYIPGIVSAELKMVLSKDVHERIQMALIEIGKKMPQYRTNEAVLVGVESRTSSPVRIPREKETLRHSQIENLWPCAEGAGYAGGIMSAALDGMRCAIEICKTLS